MAAAVLFGAASCTKEDISSSLVGNGQTVEVTFTANLPELGTRAYGDGLTAKTLQYFVYEKIGQNEFKKLDALCGTTGIEGSATVNLALIKGMTYVITFWADNNNAPYSFDGKKVTIDYTAVDANDEELDAFYGTKEFNPSVDTDTTVELRRPFAQLNAIATDFGLVKKSGINVLTSSEVTVKGYNTLNLLDGTVSGSQDITFRVDAIPEGTITDTNAHLAMNYILVNEKELVNATFKFYGKYNESDATEKELAVNTYTNIPLQRNYKTNIIGKLLTAATDFNVEIKPAFDGTEVVNVWDGKTVTPPAYDDNTKTYTVTNGAELAWIAAAANGTTRGDVDTFIGQTIVLANDIELGGHNWTPISMSTNLAGGETFRGTFDGQGHTISGLVSNQKDAAGLFGYIYAATIKNVTVKGASINSNHYAGGIVAWILNNSGNVQTATVIENCHVVNSTITSTPELVDGEWDNGDKAGGLVGYAYFDDANNERGAGIKNCSVENTTIKAYRDFGGLIGYASCVAISNCEVNNVTLEQDLTHDYKAPNTPTTFDTIIGRNEGNNTIDNNAYVANGVAKDANDNYYIYSAAGLFWFAGEVNKYSNYERPFEGKTVYLANDVDLNGAEWTPIGDYRFSANRFCGTFDGQEHTISNFQITKKTDKNDSNKSSYGFFGNMEGTVKNLTVKNATVSSYAYTGALIGRLNGGTIENCHVENSTVSNTYWQGGILIGQTNSEGEGVTSVVRNCSVINSSITSKSAVGAISGPATFTKGGSGLFENCIVENCEVLQQGSFGGSYDNFFGSFFGYIETDGDSEVVINNCVANKTTVKGNDNAPISGDFDGTIYVDGMLCISTAAQLEAAVKAGGKYILTNDIELTKSLAISNANFELDGNGYTISQAAECTNTYALFDITGGKASISNVTFDGVKEGAVVRTVGVEFTADNITAQNGNHTQQQGLFRLMGKSTITNSTFKNNTCSMVVTLNYDGANNDPQVVENCAFEGNTCNGTAVLYYVKGASCTLNGNEFVGNTVNCDTNGATVYMGFTEDNVVTNNLFQNNTVNEASDSSRVAGGIFFGYETVFTGNAFIGNTVTGTNAKGNDVCVSTYYTSIDLSGNYWGGGAPVEDDDYFVQHKSDERVVIINDYLTENPIK